MASNLFSAANLGGKKVPIPLKHRVVMAPMTRERMDGDGVPGPAVVEFYKQRATDGGLLITEATNISAYARGYYGAPGLFTPEQVEGWKNVTTAMHDKGGVIFNQSWHTGRFMLNGTNLRADKYGGSTENRARIVFEALEAILSTVTRARSDGVIISASGYDGAEVRKVVEAGTTDLVAFARDCISNPDLVERIRSNAELNPVNWQTAFLPLDVPYETGYTDYPFLSEKISA